MSDQVTRATQRLTAAGDPQKRASWLRSRVRAETLDESRLRVAAYADDLGAQLAVGCTCRGKLSFMKGHEDACGLAQRPGLSTWISGLSKLDAPVLAEVECSGCNGHGELGTMGQNRERIPMPEWKCPDCDGAGTAIFDIGSRYWTVVACVGAVRLAQETWETTGHHDGGAPECYTMDDSGRCGDCGGCGWVLSVENALNIVEYWISDPTLENTQTCQTLAVEMFPDAMAWLFNTIAMAAGMAEKRDFPRAQGVFASTVQQHGDETAIKTAACDRLILEALR